METAGVEEIFGFRTAGDGRPVRLASAGCHGSSIARADLYTSRFYRQDPLFPLISSSGPHGALAVATMAVGDIDRSEYRSECFEKAGLGEKISYFRRSGGKTFALNFYGPGPRRSRSADQLAAIAETAIPLLKRHGELLGTDAGLTLAARLERRLETAYPELTRRELQVCARTIAGMTAEAAALNLGIAESSVLTYRRRAYNRYGFSGSGEFLDGILSR
ncbi:helix-turn-helix transcriptional regulator [Sphingopyxis terrae]|uniref:helix-turn-helix transcriptional regulator n=1 Tax=Sphingopyxis terrae TaxID=33052 RepID=UPI002A11107A|nr:LuxR C-terminal-related transcriptional regulator [Sphingopyxis terrae]MDX8356495.1 LuxR C-terminal-related transcriptional regulator [Sphingopyxis terrae]